MAKLIDLRYADGFYASFDADVAELEQGEEIYLQLPDCPDSQHDCSYSSETVQECIAIIGETYSDEQLSIMSIIEDTDLSGFEVRNCELTAEVTDSYGELKNVNRLISILKKGSAYYPVKESDIHKHYTNRFAWQIDDIAEYVLNDDDLVKAFDSSSDVEETA